MECYFSGGVTGFVYTVLVTSRFRFDTLATLMFCPYVLLVEKKGTKGVMHARGVEETFLVTVALFVFVFKCFDKSALMGFITRCRPAIG